MSQETPPTSQVVPIALADDADPDGHLRVDAVTRNLKSRSARSGALMIVSHAIQLGIGVGRTAVLARLLQPQDFGYLAMVMTLTNFIGTIRDMGLPVAAVHKQHLSNEQASGLFWINGVMSITVAILVAASAPLLSWFYGEPRLVAIALVMAAGIFTSSLTMVHVGLMRRQMKFGAITALEIGAMLAGAVVGIASALAGAGYWALVFQQLTIYVWQSGSAWMLCRWRPMRRRASEILGDAGLRSMVRYGTDTTASRLLGKIGRNLDSVLVGYFAGPAVLGLYQKAYHWSITPFNQIYSPLLVVAVSSFSRLQDDHVRYRLYARTTLLGMFAITLPAMGLLFVEAEGVILLLLGQQWTESIPIFRVLTVAAFFGSFTLVTKWLFLSEGRTAEQLKWSLISAPTMVLGVAMGIRWGAVGVAYGLTAATALLTVPGVWYCLHGSPLLVKNYLGAVWRPVIASIAAAALLWLVRPFLPAMPHLIVQVALSGVVYAVLYAVCWLVLPGGWSEITRVVRQLRQP